MTFSYPGTGSSSLARIKIPVGLGTRRFLQVGRGERFVRVEDLVMHNLDTLFPGMEILACEFFRVTRNANTERDVEDADDLLALIESELQERRFAPIVRLEIKAGMAGVRRGLLAAELKLDGVNDVFETPGMLAMCDLLELAEIAHPRLHDPPLRPLDHPLLRSTRSIFHIIRDAGTIHAAAPLRIFFHLGGAFPARGCR